MFAELKALKEALESAERDAAFDSQDNVSLPSYSWQNLKDAIEKVTVLIPNPLHKKVLEVVQVNVMVRHDRVCFIVEGTRGTVRLITQPNHANQRIWYHASQDWEPEIEVDPDQFEIRLKKQH